MSRTRGANLTYLFAQKLRRLFQEEIKLIVVDPMACSRNFDNAVIADGVHARIVLRYRCKALEAPEDQRGRGDLAVEFNRIGDMVPQWRKSADVIIEFPDQ